MKVIKIGAVWCPGCLVMRPRWQDVEKNNPWLETVYYDYDTDDISSFNVGKLLPLFIFVDKDGNELERIHGEISKDKIIAKINEYKDR